MKITSKLIILSLSFLILSLAVAEVGYAASAVKGLNLHKLQGKPANDPFLHDLSKDQAFKRFIELFVIGKAPKDATVGELADRGTIVGQGKALLDCLLAARHLNSEARGKVLSINRNMSDTVCHARIDGNAATKAFVWKGESRFQVDDSYALFREKYLPQIKAAAAKVASFEGFKEIINVHAIRFNPNSYSSEKGGFTVGITPGSRIGQLSIKDKKSIYLWKVSKAKARELTEGPLRARTHIFAEEVIELGGVTKFGQKGRQSKYKINGVTKSIVLYADKARTKVLHRFAREDYLDMAAIAKRK